MKFYFHEEAEIEFDKAVAYYEECQRGLGLNFAQEVYETIGRITQFPNAWAPVSKNARRALVKRFPFGIIYRNQNGTIEIIAVADSRRRPDYWRNR
jgi:hypothetical protein